MRLILLGAPGAGKGTQAAVISERLGVPAISTGNLIRQAMKDKTELGVKAESYVESGSLVPDELVVGMLKERIACEDCKNGFILDGFPRTVPQAEALDAMGVDIDRVIDIAVDDETILERLSGRLICSSCAASFHLRSNPPKNPDICDVCGGQLIRRSDDCPETIRERLRVYHAQTEPLKDYYGAAGKLRVVDGQKDVKRTTELTLSALDN